MAETDTMTVVWPDKFGGDEVRINAADYDPAIHRLPGQPETQTAGNELPEGFPGYGALLAVGITTYDGVRRDLDRLTEIAGIGTATADKIAEALKDAD